MLGRNASKVLQQSNYRTELELWLCSCRRGFANWYNCVVTFLEGGQGNFMALSDVTLFNPRLGAATHSPDQAPPCAQFTVLSSFRIKLQITITKCWLRSGEYQRVFFDLTFMNARIVI